CFGMNKRPDDKGRYLYILLFKTDGGKLSGSGGGGKFKSSGDSADETLQLTLGKKVIDVAYQYTTDDKHAVTAETVKIGGKEIKKGDSRVFLVDLTQDKLTYQPVKVDLPGVVPNLDDTERKTWGPTMARAVEDLKKKSAEVKKFLEEKPAK